VIARTTDQEQATAQRASRSTSASRSHERAFREVDSPCSLVRCTVLQRMAYSVLAARLEALTSDRPHLDGAAAYPTSATRGKKSDASASRRSPRSP
jgi:hypothetical protein